MLEAIGFQPVLWTSISRSGVSLVSVSSAAVRVVVSTWHHASVFAAQICSEHGANDAHGSGGHVDAEVVEHVYGPGSHSTGDDDFGAQALDETRHFARLMRKKVWIGDDI